MRELQRHQINVPLYEKDTLPYPLSSCAAQFVFDIQNARLFVQLSKININITGFWCFMTTVKTRV